MNRSNGVLANKKLFLDLFVKFCLGNTSDLLRESYLEWIYFNVI